MKFLDKLSRNENKFQHIVGLNFEQLFLLARLIKPLWEVAEEERLSYPNRKRHIGGGHPYKLRTIEHKITAVLIYYKQYPTQELLGMMINMDQSAVSRLIKKMLPLIGQAADPELRTYLLSAKNDKKVRRISNLQDFIARNPDLQDISIDATEQQCHRFKNYDQQKKYYSGKAKRHTIKTQISVSSTGCILDVSGSYPGSVHDKMIIDTERTVEKFDVKIPQRLDAGYQGIRKKHPDHYLILPIKKPRGGELTKLEKEQNRIHSKRRVKVEHGISRIKKFKILGGVFRQPINTYNQVFRNVAAIVNFKRMHPRIEM